ncbi:hypothetical protein LOC71_01090 [Rhodopirellula sp. JC740]|uniref:Transposase IS200-like domain-containing protein n=1 Tax=Rhodopirellula halodulae TaxID=2894198 RepID=A0ABS8NBC6_9BACT|nr:hypothetical protein [Rhodopirellula sp. JC740]MCC9640851.1 hypothetical protein [Rhodopirellula sp. JC740]
MNEPPLAFFITFTVYGTFLQGDSRWWQQRADGHRPPQPLLEHWHQSRLKHPIQLLNTAQQSAVQEESARLCEYRHWKHWITNARSNHVHVVVGAGDTEGVRVRDQIKANCTRVLREQWISFRDRPVWTTGGSCRHLFEEAELERAILYCGEVQDRKGRDAEK